MSQQPSNSNQHQQQGGDERQTITGICTYIQHGGTFVQVPAVLTLPSAQNAAAISQASAQIQLLLPDIQAAAGPIVQQQPPPLNFLPSGVQQFAPPFFPSFPQPVAAPFHPVQSYPLHSSQPQQYQQQPSLPQQSSSSLAEELLRPYERLEPAISHCFSNRTQLAQAVAQRDIVIPSHILLHPPQQQQAANQAPPQQQQQLNSRASSAYGGSQDGEQQLNLAHQQLPPLISSYPQPTFPPPISYNLPPAQRGSSQQQPNQQVGGHQPQQQQVLDQEQQEAVASLFARADTPYRFVRRPLPIRDVITVQDVQQQALPAASSSQPSSSSTAHATGAPVVRTPLFARATAPRRVDDSAQQTATTRPLWASLVAPSLPHPHTAILGPQLAEAFAHYSQRFPDQQPATASGSTINLYGNLSNFPEAEQQAALSSAHPQLSNLSDRHEQQVEKCRATQSFWAPKKQQDDQQAASLKQPVPAATAIRRQVQQQEESSSATDSSVSSTQQQPVNPSPAASFHLIGSVEPTSSSATNQETPAPPASSQRKQKKIVAVQKPSPDEQQPGGHLITVSKAEIARYYDNFVSNPALRSKFHQNIREANLRLIKQNTRELQQQGGAQHSAPPPQQQVVSSASAARGSTTASSLALRSPADSVYQSRQTGSALETNDEFIARQRKDEERARAAAQAPQEKFSNWVNVQREANRADLENKKNFEQLRVEREQVAELRRQVEADKQKNIDIENELRAHYAKLGKQTEQQKAYVARTKRELDEGQQALADQQAELVLTSKKYASDPARIEQERALLQNRFYYGFTNKERQAIGKVDKQITSATEERRQDTDQSSEPAAIPWHLIGEDAPSQQPCSSKSSEQRASRGRQQSSVARGSRRASPAKAASSGQQQSPLGARTTRNSQLTGPTSRLQLQDQPAAAVVDRQLQGEELALPLNKSSEESSGEKKRRLRVPIGPGFKLRHFDLRTAAGRAAHQADQQLFAAASEADRFAIEAAAHSPPRNFQAGDPDSDDDLATYRARARKIAARLRQQPTAEEKAEARERSIERKLPTSREQSPAKQQRQQVPAKYRVPSTRPYREDSNYGRWQPIRKQSPSSPAARSRSRSPRRRGVWRGPSRSPRRGNSRSPRRGLSRERRQESASRTGKDVSPDLYDAPQTRARVAKRQLNASRSGAPGSPASNRPPELNLHHGLLESQRRLGVLPLFDVAAHSLVADQRRVTRSATRTRLPGVTEEGERLAALWAAQPNIQEPSAAVRKPAQATKSTTVRTSPIPGSSSTTAPPTTVVRERPFKEVLKEAQQKAGGIKPTGDVAHACGVEWDDFPDCRWGKYRGKKVHIPRQCYINLRTVKPITSKEKAIHPSELNPKERKTHVCVYGKKLLWDAYARTLRAADPEQIGTAPLTFIRREVPCWRPDFEVAPEHFRMLSEVKEAEDIFYKVPKKHRKYRPTFEQHCVMQEGLRALATEEEENTATLPQPAATSQRSQSTKQPTRTQQRRRRRRVAQNNKKKAAKHQQEETPAADQPADAAAEAVAVVIDSPAAVVVATPRVRKTPWQILQELKELSAQSDEEAARELEEREAKAKTNKKSRTLRLATIENRKQLAADKQLESAPQLRIGNRVVTFPSKDEVAREKVPVIFGYKFLKIRRDNIKKHPNTREFPLVDEEYENQVVSNRELEKARLNEERARLIGGRGCPYTLIDPNDTSASANRQRHLAAEATNTRQAAQSSADDDNSQVNLGIHNSQWYKLDHPRHRKSTGGMLGTPPYRVPQLSSVVHRAFRQLGIAEAHRQLVAPTVTYATQGPRELRKAEKTRAEAWAQLREALRRYNIYYDEYHGNSGWPTRRQLVRCLRAAQRRANRLRREGATGAFIDPDSLFENLGRIAYYHWYIAERDRNPIDEPQRETGRALSRLRGYESGGISDTPSQANPPYSPSPVKLKKKHSRPTVPAPVRHATASSTSSGSTSSDTTSTGSSSTAESAPVVPPHPTPTVAQLLNTIPAGADIRNSVDFRALNAIVRVEQHELSLSDADVTAPPPFIIAPNPLLQGLSSAEKAILQQEINNIISDDSKVDSFSVQNSSAIGSALDFSLSAVLSGSDANASSGSNNIADGVSSGISGIPVTSTPFGAELDEVDDGNASEAQRMVVDNADDVGQQDQAEDQVGSSVVVQQQPLDSTATSDGFNNPHTGIKPHEERDK